MTLYRNQKQSATLAAVEFAPVTDGNFAFFYVGNPLKKDQVKNWLTSAEMGQEIVAETQADGHAVLVTHGGKSQADVLRTLAAHGDAMVQERHKRQFDPWVARAMLGFGGQSLQLISSAMQPEKKLKHPGESAKTNPRVSRTVFNLSNLAANIIALIYGAQKSEDVQRLRFLKEKFNHDLGANLSPGDALPAVGDQRLTLHEGPKELTTSMHHFISRHSVRISEIVLRYFGAVALAFPQWKEAREAYSATRSLKAAFHAAKNPNRHFFRAGIGSVIGKTITWFSKEPDPFNPKPPTWLDTIREKYVFPVGGMIEAGAFSLYSYDHFTNPEQLVSFRGKEHQDYIGGVGSAMFVAAYLLRSGWANFSEKAVNMDELYAHVSDSLAHMPPEKLPQLMADTAAAIKAHFKDKPMDFGTIFTRLMTDAYRYHHIALQNTPLPAGNAPDKPTPPVYAARILAPARRKKAADPAAGHAEKIATESKAMPGLGV